MDGAGSNSLSTIPKSTQPRFRIVNPRLAVMDTRIQELDSIITRLVNHKPSREIYITQESRNSTLKV